MDRSRDEDRRMRGRRLKLTPVIDVYSLQGMGAELERRWTAEGDERSSLRDLAEYFNTEMLTTVLSRDGDPPPPTARWRTNTNAPPRPRRPKASDSCGGAFPPSRRPNGNNSARGRRSPSRVPHDRSHLRHV